MSDKASSRLDIYKIVVEALVAIVTDIGVVAEVRVDAARVLHNILDSNYF